MSVTNPATFPCTGKAARTVISNGRFNETQGAIPYIASGDSNTSGTSSAAESWSSFTSPAALENAGIGATRMVEDSNNLLGRIAGDVVDNSAGQAYCVTAGTNDIRKYNEASKTAAQTLALMQEDWLDCAHKINDEGLVPVIGTQHYLDKAIDGATGWANDGTNPSTHTVWSSGSGQAISETVIAAWNTWLINMEGPTTWRVAHLAEVMNDPADSAGDLGMYEKYVASGPHWNTYASQSVIKDAFQQAMGEITPFVSKEFTFSTSYIDGITWLPDETKKTRIEFVVSQSNLTGQQMIIGSDVAQGYPNYLLISLDTGAGGNADVRIFGATSEEENIASRSVDTEYTGALEWAVDVGSANVEWAASDFALSTLGTDYSVAEIIIGAANQVPNTWLFKGIIKNVRVYETDLLVRDWRINDGTTVIKELIAGDDANLNAGSGSWAARS